METRYEDYEIVRVVSDTRLIDSESYERIYWRPDGKPVAPGFYLVAWPRGADPTRYDERAEFMGPYRWVEGALVALAQLKSGQRRTAPPRPAAPSDEPATAPLAEPRNLPGKHHASQQNR